MCNQKKEQLLLVRRAFHRPQPLTWAIPSGKIQPNENPTQAIIRELEEEVGYSFDQTELHLEYVSLLDFSKDGYMVNYHVFSVIVNQGFESIVNKDEHDLHAWMTPSEVLNLPSPKKITGLDEVIEKVYSI